MSMNDKRRAARNRVLKAAKISVGGSGIIDATVRNMSERGACLQVASPLGIPDTFTLVMVSDQAVRTCRVVWRKEKQIGVEFNQG
jgi:predicted kinase